MSDSTLISHHQDAYINSSIPQADFGFLPLLHLINKHFFFLLPSHFLCISYQLQLHIFFLHISASLSFSLSSSCLIPSGCLCCSQQQRQLTFASVCVFLCAVARITFLLFAKTTTRVKATSVMPIDQPGSTGFKVSFLRQRDSSTRMKPAALCSAQDCANRLDACAIERYASPETCAVQK